MGEAVRFRERPCEAERGWDGDAERSYGSLANRPASMIVQPLQTSQLESCATSLPGLISKREILPSIP